MTRPSRLRAILIAAITVAFAAAGVTSPSQAVPGATTAADDVGWVTGVVLDGDGTPVVGDLVNAIGPREVPEAGIIADQTDRRDFTDDNGAFRVRQASPHGYLIQICTPEPSYPSACRETAQGVDHLITYIGPAGVTDSWVLQNDLFDTSSADQALGAITVKLQSFVHGTVTDAANQSIRILRTNGTVAYYGSTDASGSYRFQGLAPGHYQVAAGGDGWRPWRSPVFDLAQADDLEVNGDLNRGATIHGVVRSAGSTVPFQDIFVRRSGGDLVAVATTNEHGYYRASGLLPGRFRVGISYDGSDYTRHSVAATLTGPHAQAAAPITLVRGAVITLALRAGGGPAIRASDELRDATGHAILGLRNVNGQVTYPGLAPGRLVYAGNHRPVITTLSYQLAYPSGSPTNPTDEHPSRARTVGASGLFTVDRLAPGTVNGRLSQGADTEQITSPKFFVIFPFQDGTPYFLTSQRRSITVGPQERVRLGAIPLVVHR